MGCVSLTRSSAESMSHRIAFLKLMVACLQKLNTWLQVVLAMY